MCEYQCVCVCELEGCLCLKSFDNCGRNGMRLLHFLSFYYFFVQTNESYINVCVYTWNYLLIVCIAPCNNTKDNTQLTISLFDLRRLFMHLKLYFSLFSCLKHFLLYIWRLQNFDRYKYQGACSRIEARACNSFSYIHDKTMNAKFEW